MSKKLLIDSTQSEETRLAVLDGGKLADYDYESSVRKQLKGNVFLAKVTRVEPSLQAAFVNYGGNRHGFLPFSEIHPDYFRIPVADKEKLLAEEERIRKEMEEEDEAEDNADDSVDEAQNENDDDESDDEVDDDIEAEQAESEEGEAESDAQETAEDSVDDNGDDNDKKQGGRNNRRRGRYARRGRGGRRNANRREEGVTDDEDAPKAIDRELLWKRLRRSYKIQEVIKRGQIMLIQVTKEERGNKGAAVTSYVTLPGRYCVLMPNSPQGGGVSRKVSDRGDRKKMRDLLRDLDVPTGMAVILRTAGVSRTKTEVKRDLDYLMRLWNQIREDTMQASAPSLIYEEASLIKRAIRDVYDKEMSEVLVAGDDGYKLAKNQMKMMIPSHERRVKLYKDEAPLFVKHGIEDLIEEMDSSTVTLKSGGYLVINPTEALVSIDVNSGRSTRERHIEETALKTNLEAAEEVARQLRLRDLAGLVVVDFIDMENYKYNRQVERRLKEAMSNDRARVQIGRISNFGLMELSRQRLRSSLVESTFETCPHCAGTGNVKTIDGMALSVMRKLEQEATRVTGGQKIAITVTLHPDVALYVLNHKRPEMATIEERYGVTITFSSQDVTAVMEVSIASSKPDQAGDNDTSHHKNDGGQDGSGKSKSSRSRNRRRGGNKNNSEGDNEEKSVQEPSEATDNKDVADNKDDTTLDKGADKPKRTRSRRKKADNASDKDTVNDLSKDSTAEEAKPKSNVVEQPERVIEEAPKTASSSAKEEAPKAKKTTKRAPRKKAAAKTDEPKADDKAEPAETKTIPIKPAVNDDSEVQADRDYEVVNQKPKEKKKGWWSKIVD